MKLCVVALDYDGTIARDGRADPVVLKAVREAQTRGIVVILVTGRICSAFYPSMNYRVSAKRPAAWK